MRSHTRMTRFSRKVVRLARGEVNPNPFEARHTRLQTSRKEVSIGNHSPGTHYAPVAQIYVEPQDLYRRR